MCSASAATATSACSTPLYDVRDKVKLVSPRHEQTAGHMADGFFRVQPPARGDAHLDRPGSANLIMALAVAQTDSSALLSITANVPTSQFNRGPFQELNRHHQADFNNVIRPVVKRSFQPTRVEMLPLALRQAATTMTSGRPGPVNVDIPYNLFHGRAPRCAWSRPGTASTPAAAGPRGRRARSARLAARGRAPGDLHRPRRHAVRGGHGAHRARGAAVASR